MITLTESPSSGEVQHLLRQKKEERKLVVFLQELFAPAGSEEEEQFRNPFIEGMAEIVLHQPEILEEVLGAFALGLHIRERGMQTRKFLDEILTAHSYYEWAKGILNGKEELFVQTVLGLVPSGGDVDQHGSLLRSALGVFPQFADLAVAELRSRFAKAVAKDVCCTMRHQTPEFIRQFETELVAAIESGDEGVRKEAARALAACKAQQLLRFKDDSVLAVKFAAMTVEASILPDDKLGDLLEQLAVAPDRTREDDYYTREFKREAEAALRLRMGAALISFLGIGRERSAEAEREVLLNLQHTGLHFEISESEQEQVFSLLFGLAEEETGGRVDCIVALAERVKNVPSRVLEAVRGEKTLNRSLLRSVASRLTPEEVVTTFGDFRTERLAAYAAYAQLYGADRVTRKQLGEMFTPALRRLAACSEDEKTRLYTAAALVLLRDEEMFISSLLVLAGSAANSSVEKLALRLLKSILI